MNFSPCTWWPLRIPTQTCQLQLEAEFKHGWCALVTMPPLQLSLHLPLLIFHFMSLILSHSFESICVNLCLSGILVGNYLCPFKILIGIISVYSRYSHHPYHLNCSVWSASRESPHLQSIHVITHLSAIEFIFQAHKFVSMEGWFSMLRSIRSWDSGVAQGFILRGRSVSKLPKVSRSRAREGWLWGGVLEIQKISVSTSQWGMYFGVAVLGFGISILFVSTDSSLVSW